MANHCRIMSLHPAWKRNSQFLTPSEPCENASNSHLRCADRNLGDRLQIVPYYEGILDTPIALFISPFHSHQSNPVIIWMFPKIGGKPPKWMVKIMENPMNKWMIWGPPIIFGNTHIHFPRLESDSIKHPAAGPSFSPDQPDQPQKL